jgi:hypothetical protein
MIAARADDSTMSVPVTPPPPFSVEEGLVGLSARTRSGANPRVNFGQSLCDGSPPIVAFERILASDAHGLSQAEISDACQLSHPFRRGVVFDVKGHWVILASCTRLHE